MSNEIRPYEVDLANVLPLEELDRMYGGEKGLLVNDGEVKGVIVNEKRRNY